MEVYHILHRTYYNFSDVVELGPHLMRLRPRVSHELRIHSSKLTIQPEPVSERWHRDTEDNSVLQVTFDTPTQQLMVESEVVVHHYNESPLDFLVSDYAIHYPFNYTEEDSVVLAPFLSISDPSDSLKSWASRFVKDDENPQTYSLLEQLCQEIHRSMTYNVREEPGVQRVEETLSKQSGSCRDFAHLFIETARSLNLAARFVSGYLYAPPSPNDFGSTHAWAEVFIPGAGWVGFDPTIGKIVGTEHFPTAVSRLPTSVPPIEGTFTGAGGSQLSVGVWVSKPNFQEQSQ